MSILSCDSLKLASDYISVFHMRMNRGGFFGAHRKMSNMKSFIFQPIKDNDKKISEKTNSTFLCLTSLPNESTPSEWKMLDKITPSTNNSSASSTSSEKSNSEEKDSLKHLTFRFQCRTNLNFKSSFYLLNFFAKRFSILSRVESFSFLFLSRSP